jgi:hypothetical protein
MRYTSSKSIIFKELRKDSFLIAKSNLNALKKGDCNGKTTQILPTSLLHDLYRCGSKNITSLTMQNLIMEQIQFFYARKEVIPLPTDSFRFTNRLKNQL